MTSTEEIFLKWVFPILGGIMASLMFIAPLKTVLNARRAGDLGSINPVPYPAQTATAAAWIAYSYVIAAGGTNKAGSALLFWVNDVGFLFGLFFTFTCYGLAKRKIKNRILAQVLFFAFVLPLVGAIGLLTNMSNPSLKLMWGFTANGILLMYYFAPLSTVVTIIKKRSSQSLDIPMVLMQLINSCLWLAYGAGVADPFIYVPNAIGICTGLFLCLLILLFREKPELPKIADELDFPALPPKAVDELNFPDSTKAILPDSPTAILDLDLNMFTATTTSDLSIITPTEGQTLEIIVMNVVVEPDKINDLELVV